MKKAITLDLYSRWGEERYQKLKEHGYSGANYSMADTDVVMYTCSEEEMEEMMHHEKKLADDAGIEIVQVHAPWRYPPKDATSEDREERMEKMKRSIRATALLGCHYWVVHPLAPFGINDKDTENAKKTREINLCFMRELLKTAKEQDVIICMENMPFLNFSLSTPEDILGFVKEMNDEYFKMCLDTGHVSVFLNLDVAEEVKKCGDAISVFHIHDNDRRKDQHLIPYFGKIDWEAFFKALQDIGFGGPFTLETAFPEGLPTPIYEKVCKLAVEIADKIIVE